MQYTHSQRAKMRRERGTEEERRYMVAIRLAAYAAKRKHLTEPWGAPVRNRHRGAANKDGR